VAKAPRDRRGRQSSGVLKGRFGTGRGRLARTLCWIRAIWNATKRAFWGLRGAPRRASKGS